MAHISVKDVQQWLEQTKLTVGDVDAELEATAYELVASRLGVVGYDSSGWTDSTDTPVLVRSMVGALVAAWTYNRSYSEEDTGGNKYANRLEKLVFGWLDSITEGSLSMPDAPLPVDNAKGPAFWPDDSTGYTQQYDAAGNAIGGPYDEDIKFSMGMKF